MSVVLHCAADAHLYRVGRWIPSQGDNIPQRLVARGPNGSPDGDDDSRVFLFGDPKPVEFQRGHGIWQFLRGQAPCFCVLVVIFSRTAFPSLSLRMRRCIVLLPNLQSNGLDCFSLYKQEFISYSAYNSPLLWIPAKFIFWQLFPLLSFELLIYFQTATCACLKPLEESSTIWADMPASTLAESQD